MALQQVVYTEALLTNSGAGQTFRSSAFATNGVARLVGTVAADQGGTLNIDWSHNGVQWDGTQNQSISAATATPLSFEVVAPYARVRYVNGATAQKEFRLSLFLRTV